MLLVTIIKYILFALLFFSIGFYAAIRGVNKFYIGTIYTSPGTREILNVELNSEEAKKKLLEDNYVLFKVRKINRQ